MDNEKHTHTHETHAFLMRLFALSQRDSETIVDINDLWRSPSGCRGASVCKRVIITAAISSFIAFIVAKDTFPAKKSEADGRKAHPLVTQSKCPIIYMDRCFQV